jgi:acyl transferase domain-containing protein
MLAAGRDATRWLSVDELLAAGERMSAIQDPNYVRATMQLPDMEMFDADFFGFTPREAAILDPQHRHFIECCWEALEDAGQAPPEAFKGSIGVFGGCGMQAYMAYNLLTNPELVEQVGMFLLRHTGNDKDFLTTRVSYLFNLHGPSVGVQTACSTSLVAVHTACQSLLARECDMALAGGVSIDLPHGRGYRHAEGEILSSTGYCRAFDDAADGTLFGSGAGVVALRRLEDALADGDNIHAVILGSAINNDGARKAGYLAPSVDGQAVAAVGSAGDFGRRAGQHRLH